MTTTYTDVCVLGAGPGGAAAALKLSHLGTSCVLLDKSTFPRDKICGDAISSKVTLAMHRMDPQMVQRFEMASITVPIRGVLFAAPSGTAVDIPYGGNLMADLPEPGYVATRLDFDNFLVEEVRRRADIDLREGVEATAFERVEGGYRVTDKTGEHVIECRILIDATGANSKFSRHHVGIPKEDQHYAGGIRAYYKNVKGMHPDGRIELHYVEGLTPGYFWIFPLPGNRANIGAGMRTDFLSKRKTNLKKVMLEAIQEHPAFKERFAEAEMTDKVRGYPLPLGSKLYTLSGDHYMLVGDAGHLIDPLTGEGIGNAVYSGTLAAEQAVACLAAGDFSAATMRAYDTRIKRVIGRELKVSYRLQKMASYPWLVNLLVGLLARNQKAIQRISEMYTNEEERKNLFRPTFWFKVMLGRA